MCEVYIPKSKQNPVPTVKPPTASGSGVIYSGISNIVPPHKDGGWEYRGLDCTPGQAESEQDHALREGGERANHLGPLRLSRAAGKYDGACKIESLLPAFLSFGNIQLRC